MFTICHLSYFFVAKYCLNSHQEDTTTKEKQSLYFMMTCKIKLGEGTWVTFNPLSSINLNPFKPEFTVVIFIHYKPLIVVAICDL